MSGGQGPAPTARGLLIVATVDNMIRDFLLPFARHYRSLGWRVDALAARDDTYDECAADFDHVWDIDWSRSLGGLRGGRTQLRRVRSVVADGRYDIVHVHTPIAALITRFALRRRIGARRPCVIYTAHGFHFSLDRLTAISAAFLAAEKIAGRWTNELVVINRADHAAATRWGIVEPPHLHLMPGIGLDTERFRQEDVARADITAVRTELGLGLDAPLFLMIAEFTANKRHDDAIRALARLRRPDAHLAIAGRAGPALAATRRLIEELDLTERVHIIGFRHDIKTLLRASVATVLVSAREGLPLSVMESLAVGTPVIGTNIRGVEDLLADGGGVLVDVGDVPAIARAMAWMIDHPAEARACGEFGRRQIAKYDIRHIIALHDALYASCVVGQLRVAGPHVHTRPRAETALACGEGSDQRCTSSA